MLFILATLIFGCSDAELAGTAEQRELGQAVLKRGLEFRLSPGTIVTRTEISVEARASAPLPTFSLSTGPDGASDVDIALDNIHHQAIVRLRQITPLTSQEMLGCPDQADAEPVRCGEDGDNPACASPSVERPANRAAQVALSIDQFACRRVSYSLELGADADDAPLEFGVLGRTASLDQLRSALEAATADEPDFVVLLGDNAENASLNGLRDLALVLRRADYPTIVLPGEDEIVEDSRSQFLETFGPFDFRWEVKGSHMVAFYSAEAELGEDGVDRLQNTLDRLSDTRPRLLFTHTPPVDPLGPRDEGFESQIEGARTLSVLTEHGVDALFTGHINDQASQTINGVKTHLTSVERVREYLWVVVDGHEVAVERRGF